ncbi:MAG: NAD(P)H-quinone oxidoreductase [Alphaproteobacteria bacterium GM7ARS4]|nr:NAD(P)H-quinone oxidoreductase [Alphaproteobacteria bacterium GM7ARS4]
MGTLPSVYRAVIVEDEGKASRLRVVERPMPSYGAGDIVVKVHGAGVNRADILQRQGLYPPPSGASDVMGLEVSGEVVALGSSVRRFKRGDKVCAILAGGGYGSHCVFPEVQALPVVGSLSMLENAVLPEVWCTVWSMVMNRGQFRQGETFLVHGASGGVGMAALQLGALYGRRVFGTASGDVKRRYCRDVISADVGRIIDYEEEDFVSIIKEETGGKGVDVILDMVGGDYVSRNLACLGREGRLLYIAFLKGSKVTIDLLSLMLKRQTLTGATLRVQPPAVKGALMASLQRHIFPLMETGQLVPCLERVFPLERVQEAHEHMESGMAKGKIAIDMMS